MTDQRRDKRAFSAFPSVSGPGQVRFTIERMRMKSDGVQVHSVCMCENTIREVDLCESPFLHL